ncbi:MAG: polysaccharide deacetylase family protein [Acidimicrobiales bacterium]
MTLPRRAFLLGAGAGAIVAACAKGGKAATPTTDTASTASPPPTTIHQGPAVFRARGATTATGVAVTFHTAGDPAITQSILDQAAALNAKLTFFVVGTWLTANPNMVGAIQAGGHELGNHTWSHINLPHLSPDAMHAEIAKCADALQRATGSIGKWFRPSQTDVPTAAILDQAGQVGYATSVGYDVDPLDYENPGSSLIVSRTRARVKPGSIVSLHTLYKGTADAFTPIIAAIRAKGLEPVTVSTLLEQ